MQKTISLPLLLFFTLCSLFSCVKGEKNSNDDLYEKDREKMLTEYVDNFVLPAYSAMKAKMDSLAWYTDQFIATPNLSTYLSLKVNGFESGYLMFQKMNVAEFGPAENQIRLFLNTYPVTELKVNTNIYSGSYDLATFGNTDAQGFPAIDYMLNALPTADENIAMFTTDSNAAKRKKYLKDVVLHMVQIINTTKTSWEDGKVNFISKHGTDVSSSTSNLLNNFVQYFEKYLRTGKVGLPVGAFTGSAAPQLVESKYSPELTKKLMIAAFQSFKDFYEGKSFDGTTVNTVSLKSFFSKVGTKDSDGNLSADKISNKLSSCISKSNALAPNFSTEVVDNRPEVMALYDELQSIVPLLKVDLISAFGVSVTYVDTDGD